MILADAFSAMEEFMARVDDRFRGRGIALEYDVFEIDIPAAVEALSSRTESKKVIGVWQPVGGGAGLDLLDRQEPFTWIGVVNFRSDSLPHLLEASRMFDEAVADDLSIVAATNAIIDFDPSDGEDGRYVIEYRLSIN